MTDTVLALDFGVYSPNITVAQFEQAKALGYEACIIGLWHGQSKNPYAQQQVMNAWAAFLEEGYYVFLGPPNWTPLSGKEQVKAGIWAAPTCTTIAIDVEIDVHPDTVVDALLEANRYGRPCIYTGRWFWNWWLLKYHDWFASHTFDSFPAWLADYDWQPVLDTPRLAHLGPVVGKQFKGSTTEVAGINADLNVFSRAWLFGEDDMATPAEFDALKRRVEIAEEGRRIDADCHSWTAMMGTDDEGTYFDTFIQEHIAWRLRDKPGWTVPA
jgi:hypothetical protein